MKKIIIFTVLSFLIVPQVIYAACTGPSVICDSASTEEECNDAGGGCVWTTTGGPIGASSNVSLKNPLPTKSPEVLIGNVINAVLGIVGSLALAMFIYGGLTWMLAAGNDQRVQKGKDILLWATIGLVVIFSSYALVRFVFVGLGFEYTN